MRYFAVLLPMLNSEKSLEYREQHLHYLDQKRIEGKIIANGRFADGSGGLVIYRVASLEEVEQITKQDPYVLQGARGFEIHEWDMVSDALM
ncbi:YciI family protein [Psychrobacillus sp. NPDC096623]|uniref:YciI family protein n=1 Tax=Psychrobacillus sp. NPDC096623 TaxID=3364492 RepID=UPI00382D895D